MLHRALNRDEVGFHLREAHEEIGRFLDEMNSGKHDDSAEMVLRIRFAHLIEHLALAWHLKWMNPESVDELSTAEWAALSRLIPNWGLNWRLVELDWMPTGEQPTE
jgi:hypothetical protein